MDLKFLINVIFYTIFILLLHNELKKRERKAVKPENFTTNLNQNDSDLPFHETDTIIPLEDVNKVDTQTQQDLLKYLNIEKKESANKSNSNNLATNDLDKFFPNNKKEYTFREVPTKLENLENFSDLNYIQDNTVSAFEEFETQYATI